MKTLKNLLVKKLIYGGYGLAHVEGKSVFVDYALPNEVVDAEVYRENKNYFLARTKRVVLPSSVRRDAPCPYYQECGGCQLQHLDYAEQIKAKEDMLLDTLKRIGKIELKNLESSLYAEEFGYRIRAQFKVDRGRLGFFKRKSHSLIQVENCLLVHPAINQLLPALRELLRKIQTVKEVHVLYSPNEDEFLVKLLCDNTPPTDKMRKLKNTILPKKVMGIGVYGEGEVYHIGRDFSFIEASSYRYRVCMDSFLQVNYLLWDRFIASALPKASFNKVLELHCGVGFFSLPLSKNSKFVVAYDSNRSAIKDAEYNAKINCVENVSFNYGISTEAIKKHAGEVIDLLFLDPPRSGLSGGEAKLVLKNKPNRIVYVSCEPTTLARDLKVFLEGGYKIESLRMVDNFPNTYHIEVIAHLVLD
ncbi:MAG: class I SAM-dependent RNA methyltransferase [Aquificaceae bacterium]|nr:class I SAM-dependent RNA methyltransferase [Aquificaceae bacterium]